MNEGNPLVGKVKRIEQRSERPALGLDHLPDLESFDCNLSPSGNVLSKTSYTRGGAVYRVENYHYDERERLVRIEQHKAGGSLVSVTTLQHDESGREIGWTEHDSDGKVVRRGTKTYSEGGLSKEETFEADGRLIRKRSFYWSEAQLSHSIVEYYGANWECGERWMESYDETGRLLETYGLQADNSPLGDGRYTYEYDSSSRVWKVRSFNDLSQNEEPDSLRVFEYETDPNGNVIEKRVYHHSRGDEHWTGRLIQRAIQFYE